MRVLIDEDTAVQLLEPLRHLLRSHTVDHIAMIKWKGKKDRTVYADATRAAYDVIITRDHNQLSDLTSATRSRNRDSTTYGTSSAARAWWGLALRWGLSSHRRRGGYRQAGAGYGTERIVCREPTVPKLFLINVALYAVLLIAAASIVVRHRRRSRGRPLVPVRRRRGTIAEPAGEDTAQNDIAAAPRLGSDSGAPGSGPDLPAEPKGTAESKAPDAPSLGSGPRGPEAEPDGPAGDARAATSDEPIVSYYEQADRPMSDYLETLGWPHKPNTNDPGGSGGRFGS